jgi:hypothetical protein
MSCVLAEQSDNVVEALQVLLLHWVVSLQT